MLHFIQMETSQHPNTQARRTERENEALETLRPVWSEALNTDLVDARRSFEEEQREGYELAYNQANRVRTHGTKLRQQQLGLRFTGDPMHDTEAMQQYAVDRSEERADLAVSYRVEEIMTERLDLDPESSEFADIHRSLVDLVTAREEEWYGDDDDPADQGILGRLSSIESRPGQADDRHEEAGEEEPAGAEQEERHIDQLAQAKHEAFAAKLRAPIFGKKRKEAMAAYETAEQAYLTQVAADEAAFAAETREQGASTEEINEALVVRINERARADEAAQKTAMLEQGGRRAKALNWYANRSKTGKIALNVAAGAALAVAGSAAAVIAGVAGTGAGMVGAGMLAGRYGRAYASRVSRLYDNKEDQPVFELDDNSAENQQAVDRSIDFLRTTSRDHIENAEKLKKGAVIGAIGAVALGGSIVVARDIINDSPNIGFGAIGEKLSDWFGDDTPDVDPPGNEELPPPPVDEPITRGEMFDGYQGTREFTTVGQTDFNKWINGNGGYTVQPGDTVWSLSEQYLQQNGITHPTVYEVDAVKDSVLKELQARGLADGRGWLNVGDTIKIK